MAMRTSQDVLATVLITKLPGWRDLLYTATPLMEMLDKEAYEGGYAEQSEFSNGEHAPIVDIVDGYEEDPKVYADTFDKMQWQYGMMRTSVALTMVDEAQASGPDAKVELFAARTKLQLSKIGRTMESIFTVRPSATPSVGRDLHSLDGTVDTTCFFENLAYGAQTNTVGTKLRSSYPRLQHQYYDLTAGWAVAGEAAFIDSQIWMNNHIENSNGGFSKMLVSPTFMRLAITNMSDLTRYTQGEKIEYGKLRQVSVGGAQLSSSIHLPITAGANKISAFAWVGDAINLRYDKRFNWEFGPVMEGGTQAIYKKRAHWRGQLRMVDPEACAVFVNGEA